VKAFLLIAVLAGAEVVPVPFYGEFQEAAKASGVPEDLLISWAFLESSFEPEAVGGAAVGIMQLEPMAWAQMTDEPLEARLDPDRSIAVGAEYLAWLQSVIVSEGRSSPQDWRLAFAAYNHGVGNVLAASSWEGIPWVVRLRVQAAYSGSVVFDEPSDIEMVGLLDEATKRWLRMYEGLR